MDSQNKTRFSVWAPLKEKLTLHIVSPVDRQVAMSKNKEGYFELELEDVSPGARYFFNPDDEGDFPDPASKFQPDGVHGPSALVDHSRFEWTDDNWRGIPLRETIIYELHVGTFTKEGSFEAIIPFLDELKDTGINAIELMPVAQFPGNRNWGYDAVFPYAVQNSYGGPDGLKRLVNACHEKGISVFLDVVYNHLGPEGNYLGKFGPYFTDRYVTPWGDALNFDGPWSDGVRDFFINNALYWFEHYHIDGLRLDAVHTIFDSGAVHFWELLHKRVSLLEEKLGRQLYMVAESDLNSTKVVKLPEAGGFGFDAQWLDDFHHALYVILDEEGKKRYADFGTMEQLAKAFADGFVHSGEWVQFRKRKHGSSSAGTRGDKFVVFNNNHDQAGNRIGGERLCMLVNEERVKLAAAAIMLSPYVPMLFMGEEYADDTPFFYFVSHSDEELIEAVRNGRKEEFKEYGFDREPPDAQSEDTFLSSKINWHKRNQPRHKTVLEWHKHLITLRRTHPVLQNFDKNDIRAHALGERGLLIHRYTNAGRQHLVILFNFSEEELSCTLPNESSVWKKMLDSKAAQWMNGKEGNISADELQAKSTLLLPPLSVVVYEGFKEN